MAKNNVIVTSKIEAASAGNMQLKETLYQIAKNLQLSATVQNTSNKNTPGEAVATVSALGSSYIVQLVLPGTLSPTSVLQGVQAAAAQTQQSNTTGITAVYHQIQAATTPRFDAGSDLHQYGGNTGSVQLYWNITDLPTGQYYFRSRSSFDGQNWNLWKLANGGKPVGGRGESVTQETVVNGVSAVFTLPGKELVAFVAGLANNGDSFTLPENLYSSAMMAIAGPNGYKDTGHPSHGVQECDILIQDLGESTTGPADFPISVGMLYQDGSGNSWAGSANFFAFAFDPLGTNVSLVVAGLTNWAVFTLPGGGKMAVGAGNAADGTTITLPPNFAWADAQFVASPQNGYSAPNEAHGVFACSISGTGVVSMSFKDGVGNVWTGTAQYLVIAFSPGLLDASGFHEINTPGGSQVAIGSGTAASGTVIGLPAGYDWSKALVFVTPSSFVDTGHPFHGIANCSANRGIVQAVYQDGEGNTWYAGVNWMVFAWQ
jgi:hypothetical protein